MIPKREYNPQLSAFSNMMLDLVDFKDRVRPLSNDIARIEQTYKYQKISESFVEQAANYAEQQEEAKPQITGGRTQERLH